MIAVSMPCRYSSAFRFYWPPGYDGQDKQVRPIIDHAGNLGSKADRRALKLAASQPHRPGIHPLLLQQVLRRVARRAAALRLGIYIGGVKHQDDRRPHGKQPEKMHSEKSIHQKSLWCVKFQFPHHRRCAG